MKDVFIVAAGRTPIGSFGGVFAGLPATELGALAVKGTLESIRFDPARIDELYFGSVVQANLGQGSCHAGGAGSRTPPFSSCHAHQ
ncbi:MAG: hypothetical protein LRY55_00625 [Leadbetterella sp.]|nr:hypothetical protein [Leadbetterella sp.]